MRIAVMGAGAIGGYLGGRLAQAGHEVHLIARGAHLEAMRARGLRIESPHGDFATRDIGLAADPAEVGPVEAVIFAVKLADTDAAAAALAPLLGPETKVVTLQNGVDSRAMIARHVEPARIAAGIIYLGVRIREPGVIESPGGAHRMTVDALGGDATIAALAAAFEPAVAADMTLTDDAERTIWEKFVALAAFSGVTCLVRGPIGLVYAHAEALAFFRRLLEENLAVAAAEGRRFPDDHAERVIALFAGQPYGQRSSMLVDLEAGKPLELPWLSGRVAELARRHGIDAPANAAVVAALAPHAAGAPAG